jgi:hypothetical protein
MSDRWERSGEIDPDAPIEPGPQPDPMLNPGRTSRLGQVVVAIVIVFVVTVVFYGLNHSGPENSQTNETATASTRPQPPQTTGQDSQPAPNEQAQPARPETSSPKGQGTR